MSGAPDNHETNKRLAILEERMNTHQAEYRTDIARLAESLAQRDVHQAQRDAQITKSLAARDVDAAKRETRLQLVIVGTIVAVGGLATAVLGLLITA